ncbi:MAG: PIN domain-containing protein [candidate division KSB1 bacterium]|nr:PIN domain-containing protein [candidate division KSB1 bacterium]
MYLIDTNIFLEILLKQDKSEACKFFLHSIGVILFRQNEEKTLLKFLSDILLKSNLLSLPKKNYEEIINIKNEIGLDFDDSYQYSICKHYNLKFITMDQDFKKVKDIDIQFL